jgi:hypothetical protein
MLLPFFLARVFLPITAAQAQRPFPGRAGIKAGHHISARLPPVNRKMAKLVQVQAVVAAW